jgi:hypothetical protein
MGGERYSIMAIKYLDGNRIRGTATERLALTTLGSKIHESGTSMTDYTYNRGSVSSDGWTNGSNNFATLTFDLGFTLEDNWVLDFEMRGNSGNAGDTNAFGITDDPTHSQNLYGNDAAGFAQVNRSKDMMRNPAGTSGNQNQTSLGIANNTWYDYSIRYDGTDIKLYREGSTHSDLTLAWTDAGNLRYPIFEYYQPGGVNHGGNFNIRNVVVYNGIDDPDDEVAAVHPNLPAGTIFEQTNDYKYYMWDGTSTWTVMVAN